MKEPSSVPQANGPGFGLKTTLGRRRFLQAGLGLAAASIMPKMFEHALAAQSPGPQAQPLDLFFHDLEQRTFRFFWDTANPGNGLCCDRFPSPSTCSISAVGFALTAYPIGIERGYVGRDEARARVLTTLRFFHDAPQGPAARGTAGHKGFFYHFIDMKTGLRTDNRVELSTVDTALLIAGMLFVQSYFDRDEPEEAEIRRLADTIYRRVDWRWAQVRPPAICHGWTPEKGFMKYDWRGYNEAMIVYLLALGSPTHPVGPDAWTEWTSTYDLSWGPNFGEPHLGFPSMFGHHYSHVWVDFRGIQDAYMRGRGIDYFENNRRAVYAQREYAIANPCGWKDYGADVWGVTASDGPALVRQDYAGEQRVFYAYKGRGVGGFQTYDDGTLAPTASAASIAFAPDIVIPAVLEMNRRYGHTIYAEYGFLDSFNPSFDYDIPLQHGRWIPGFGWVATDYLGIDQGPIVAMIENYRTELVWRVMRGNTHLRRGLERAGFAGGWLGNQV